MIGTSAAVHPAASLVPLAPRGGAKVVEIDIGRIEASDIADTVLEGSAGDVLPRLLLRGD